MKNYITTRRNNDLFDEAFENFFRPFYADSESTFMKTDIKETDANYVLDVEMPGLDKKDISLKFESGYITVSAKKEVSESDGKYLRRERAVSCSRSYYWRCGRNADQSKVRKRRSHRQPSQGEARTSAPQHQHRLVER